MPALQVWHPSGTPFSLGSSTEIIIAPRQMTALKSTASEFAQDLHTLTGAPAARIEGSTDPHAGDIMLALGAADTRLGDEGYTLRVGVSITVSAPTEAGIFYGTRTLLQMFHEGRVVPGGTHATGPPTRTAA